MANLQATTFAGPILEDLGTATSTESGTALTTPIVGSNYTITSNDTSGIDSVYTTSGKTVVVWAPYDSGNKPKGQVAIVTGDGISYGPETTVSAGGDALGGIVVGYEQTENKVLACYRSNAGVTPHQHTMTVGTVSGANIFWGTPAVLAAGTSGNYGELGHTSMTWVGGIGGDTTNRLVVAYDHANQVNNGSKIAVLTISGTTPTQHATTAIQSNSINFISVVYIGGGKVVVAFNGTGTGHSRVGTVTGGGTNTIALGSTTNFSSGLIYSDQDVANDGTADKFVIAYFEGSSNALKLYARVGSVSGTTITYGTAVEIAGENQANYPRHMSLEYHEAAGKFLVCYRKGGSTNTVLKSFSRSGTTITNVGSETTLMASENIGQSSSNYDPINKRVLFFRSKGTSGTTPTGAAADLFEASMTLDLSTGNYFNANLNGVMLMETGARIKTEDENDVELQKEYAPNITGLTITESLASGTTQNIFLRTKQSPVARRFIWSSITNVKWAGGGTGPNLNSTENTSSIISFTTFDEGTTWYGSVVGQNYLRNSILGGRGIFAGGDYNDTGFKDGNPEKPMNALTIDYITISTPGNATDFGDLSDGRGFLGAASDGSRGVIAGGKIQDQQDAATSLIDYITISAPGNATYFGDLFQARSRAPGASGNGSRAVFCGGSTNTSDVDTIDYIIIATTSNALDFGNMDAGAGRDRAACSSGTRAVIACGNMTSGGVTNKMEYITFATPTNGTTFGNNTMSRRAPAATSDGSRGVIGLGIDGSSNKTNTVDYITIATTGDATDFGDLTRQHYYTSACSDGIKGVWGGGWSVPVTGGTYSTYTIDYITIATLGHGTDFGDLTSPRDTLAACSGD